MTFFQFANHWWNLPFLVMLGLVAAFFVLQLVGLVGHDADADADHDVHVDADHDADADHDVDAAGDGGSVFQGALSFFGVERVPFMVVWGTLFIFGGFAGIFFNRFWFVRLGGNYPGWLFVVGLAFAMAVGLFFTRQAVRLASKFVDTGGRGSARKHELVGSLGVVASAHVDEGFGEIRVHDRAKNEMIVHARVRAGERRLQRGEAVVLVDFEERRELFLVEPSDLEGKTGIAS